MKKQAIILILAFAFLAAFAYSDDSLENISGTGDNLSISDNSSMQVNQTDNLPADNSSINQTPQNETAGQAALETGYIITNFIPKEFKMGEVQLSIQVQNTGTSELKNLMAFVSGKGFSISDLTPIDLLKPGEKSYILLMGRFEVGGNITLAIKIGDKVFYQDVKVIDPNSGAEEDLKKLQEAEAKRKEALSALSGQLDELMGKYSTLENDFEAKKNSNYDVSAVNLADLKSFLRDAQSNLIVGDVEHASASLGIALSEYNDQKSRLDKSKAIKRSLIISLKDKAIILSTLAGAIIASFTLYELLKKKRETLTQTIKVVVEKSKKPKEEPGKEDAAKKEAKKEEPAKEQ